MVHVWYSCTAGNRYGGYQNSPAQSMIKWLIFHWWSVLIKPLSLKDRLTNLRPSKPGELTTICANMHDYRRYVSCNQNPR